MNVIYGETGEHADRFYTTTVFSTDFVVRYGNKREFVAQRGGEGGSSCGVHFGVRRPSAKKGVPVLTVRDSTDMTRRWPHVPGISDIGVRSIGWTRTLSLGGRATAGRGGVGTIFYFAV